MVANLMDGIGLAGKRHCACKYLVHEKAHVNPMVLLRTVDGTWTTPPHPSNVARWILRSGRGKGRPAVSYL